MVRLGGLDNDDKIVRTSNLDYIPNPKGIGHAFFTHMTKYKDKVAQIDGLTGKKDSFGALLERCVRTAIAMRSKGVTTNDIVSLCSFNHLNSCVPFIATLFLDAKIASLDPTLSLTDTIHLLKQVAPKIIFVAPEAVKLIEEAIKEVPAKIQIVVFGHTETHIPFSDFLRPNEQENNFVPQKAKSLHDTSLIFFSSGTSGMPKGICTNQFAFMSQIVNTLSLGLCTDVILAFASFYWVTAALFCGVSIFGGTARLVVPKFDADTVWEKVHKYKPTFMFLAPNQALAMCNDGRPEGIDSSSLKDVIVGGSPMSGKQIISIRLDFPKTRVRLGYGMTEVVGFVTFFKPNIPNDIECIVHKPNSTGTVMLGINYKIVNLDTEECLGPNEEGELRLKTDFHLNGYHNLDSSDVWDSNGWIKTGDIAYYDEDRCFYIVDRIKEMLKFQSWHVPPAIIENVLLTHPLIKSAVVIGKLHEIDGDHPMAIVILQNGSKFVTTKEIEMYVAERVHDRQKLRGGVKIVNQLPTTPTGKINRREVKKTYSKA